MLEDICADYDHLYLFLDNCSIHDTRTVDTFIAEHRHRLTVIWNAACTPNLNLVEGFRDNLKRSAIHNYYFESGENPEVAIMKAVNRLNGNKN